MSQTFAALADPTRRAILARLMQEDASVAELAKPFDLSVRAVSKHVRVLERAGLISRRRDAQKHLSRIRIAPLKEVDQWLRDYRRCWEESLDSLEIYVKEMQQKEDPMVTSDAQPELEADRELVVSRVFHAPARLLFEAYSKPEHLRRWFGPVGWPLTYCEVDFRVGGAFRFQMTGPNGQKGPPFGGTYLQIEPNRRIVYDNGFETPGSGRMTVTVTFEEDDGQTTLTIRTLFDSVEMMKAHMGRGYEQGVNSGLDQLADLAAEMKEAEGQ